jgi:DNA (cytosine-5)-methyltransferase 1
LEKNTKFIGVDIFSGVGGMSIGAEMAGITIAFAVENNIHAAETFKFNHKNSEVIKEDIKKVNFKKLLKKPPFILFGGPPCQGFSLSNTKTRTIENPNNALFEEYLRSVEELNPEWLVFENVQGFQNFDKGRVVKELEKRLQALGYTSKKRVLWASDYGVPQNRNRFFLIANRLGIEYEFPEPLPFKVSVWDAIGDLPKLKNGDSFESLPYTTDVLSGYTEFVRGKSTTSTQNFVSKNKDYVIERYKHIKIGQNWQAIPESLMANYKDVRNTHSSIYKRLDPNQPSVVISNYRKNMLIHPFEDRGLSVREAARLQSFPDNFIFKGSISYIQQQIGNAVPPLLAYHIFKSIISFTNAKRRIKQPIRSSLLEV